MQTRTNATQPTTQERVVKALQASIMPEDLRNIQLLFDHATVPEVQEMLEEQFELAISNPDNLLIANEIHELYILKKMLQKLVENLYSMYTANMHLLEDVVVIDLLKTN